MPSLFDDIDDNKFAMLRLFEGVITIESLKGLSYKDACKFHSDAVKIAEHHQKEMKKIQSVKRLPN